VCGALVPRKAKACPECGACERSGWSHDTAYDGLDLPDENFDYKKFAAEEFGAREKKSATKILWWIVSVLVLISFIWLTLHGAW
jgi:predicted nucleic acid-binding Zn ribbon protein